MPWTDRQQRCALVAANKAGWNDQQRYMAMLHAGCPKSASGQVSLKSKDNPHAAFEQYMAIAESAAAARGETIYAPDGKPSWNSVAQDGRSRQIDMIIAIWDEARRVLNTKFAAGGLDGFVQRMTSNDESPSGFPLNHDSIYDCDSAQVYRILEGLKGWVGREFAERGWMPDSFKLHFRDRKRLEEIKKRTA